MADVDTISSSSTSQMIQIFMVFCCKTNKKNTYLEALLFPWEDLIIC